MARLYVLQDFEPVRDVESVVRARFGREVEIGTKERGSQFGDELLECVSFIAPFFCARNRGRGGSSGFVGQSAPAGRLENAKELPRLEAERRAGKAFAGKEVRAGASRFA